MAAERRNSVDRLVGSLNERLVRIEKRLLARGLEPRGAPAEPGDAALDARDTATVHSAEESRPRLDGRAARAANAGVRIDEISLGARSTPRLYEDKSFRSVEFSDAVGSHHSSGLSDEEQGLGTPAPAPVAEASRPERPAAIAVSMAPREAPLARPSAASDDSELESDLRFFRMLLVYCGFCCFLVVVLVIALVVLGFLWVRK
eukprot:c28609_g1_i1.p1 GENE.c28609_g1_i1~~c28609_g1_i1.p1  ORF type:complete len:203 (+),score=25.80 c28609_g1_i1:78-686(+)